MGDFGSLFIQVMEELVIPIWNREIVLFGHGIKIFSIILFCMIGSVVIWFFENLRK